MIDLVAFSPQPGRHFRIAIERDLSVLLVNQLHQRTVQSVFTFALNPARGGGTWWIRAPRGSTILTASGLTSRLRWDKSRWKRGEAYRKNRTPYQRMKRVGISSKTAEQSCLWTACPARVTILDDPKYKNLNFILRQSVNHVCNLDKSRKLKSCNPAANVNNIKRFKTIKLCSLWREDILVNEGKQLLRQPEELCI